jgi:hydrogenase maturation protein HypF
MHNAILLEHISTRIAARGLRCLIPSETPTDDGGIALGQAVVAAALG